MEKLKNTVKEIALQEGASLVGITTKERLDGPSCSDLTYLLPEGKSAIVLGISIDRNIIKDYLGKKNFSARDAMNRHEGELYHKLWKIETVISMFLKSQGYKSVNTWPNKDYREYKSGRGTPGPFAFTPEFSHRYAAVAAGLGGFGWSSNIVTKEYGAAVYFSSVLTDAPFEPDPLIPESPCDNCKMCAYACQAGFIQKGEKKREIKLGGKVFQHGMNEYLGRCALCCGGWINRHQYPDWSTFSSLCVDFTFPEKNDEFDQKYKQMVLADLKGPDSRAKRNILHHIELTRRGMHETKLDEYKVVCAFCQLICWGNKKERADNLKLLQKSGVVTIDDKQNEVIIRNGGIIDSRPLPGKP